MVRDNSPWEPPPPHTHTPSPENREGGRSSSMGNGRGGSTREGTEGGAAIPSPLKQDTWKGNGSGLEEFHKINNPKYRGYTETPVKF